MHYLIARTAAGRPTLQHALSASGVRTLCGIDTTWWSRAYQAQRISQIICKTCSKKGA